MSLQHSVIPASLMERLIKQKIQLVTIANDYCLLPRYLLQTILYDVFIVGGELVRTVVRDFSNRPSTRYIYIHPKGIPTTAGKPHVQKIRLGYIDQNGGCDRWRTIPVFPNKLYIKFINVKDSAGMKSFLNQTGFCIFPSYEEIKNLFMHYKEIGIKKQLRVFNLSRKKYKSKEDDDHSKILYANIEFIEKKRDELREKVRQYAEGVLQYDNLLWLNKQMEDVSNILMNGSDEIWKGIQEGVRIEKELGEGMPDTRTLKEIGGLENIKDIPIVPGLRIYGHFAYCCYEFYQDILNKKRIAICQEPDCMAYFRPTRLGQIYCKNFACQSRRVAARNRKTD